MLDFTVQRYYLALIEITSLRQVQCFKTGKGSEYFIISSTRSGAPTPEMRRPGTVGQLNITSPPEENVRLCFVVFLKVKAIFKIPSSCCFSRWSIGSNPRGNSEQRRTFFHYEPRLQQEKRWAENNSSS